MPPNDPTTADTATGGLCKWIAATQTAAALTGRDGQLIAISNRLKLLFPELPFDQTNSPVAHHTGSDQDICFVKFLASLVDARSESVISDLWEVIRICGTGPLSHTMPLNCVRNSQLLLTISCQINHSGEPCLLIWAFQESTVQRRLQQRDLHSSKMEAISRLAGGMAHEFNNLLTAILGNLELVRSQPTVQVSEVAGRLESAEVAALRASQLIRELRRFASREAPQREVVPITTCLRKVQRILAGMVSRNIEVSYSFEDEDILFAEINSGQLEEAILKLCTNSAEAIGATGSGKIHISAGVLRDNSEQPNQDVIQIQVLDSGPGMNATIRERAFEPFFTTKDSERAFGLGMAIAYGLVEEMGGTIQISDTISSGSQVNIYFPLQATPPDAAGGAADSPEQTPPRQLHIAMVDNELSIRSVTGGMLKFLGHQANLFADGAKFLDQVKSGQRFDLVLMDNVMPGMTGRSTYERLRVIDANVPVIVCSGRALDLTTFSHPTTRQPDAFLAKPFSISDLATAIAPFT